MIAAHFSGAVRVGVRGRVPPAAAAAQLARLPWTTPLTAASGPGGGAAPVPNHIASRMNSTIVDRPAIYDAVPPPPPPPARPSSSIEEQPASDFQAVKHEAEEAENASKSEINRQIFLDAVNATAPRRNWTRKEVAAIYYQPVLELAHQAVSPKPNVPFFDCVALLVLLATFS